MTPIAINWIPASNKTATIGVMGEYVGRVFVESKARPLYLLDSYLGPQVFEDSAAPAKTVVG